MTTITAGAGNAGRRKRNTGAAPAIGSNVLDAQAQARETEWRQAESALDQAIERSKTAGTVHLDDVPPDVENMRGLLVRSLRDDHTLGVIITLGSDQVIRVLWLIEAGARQRGFLCTTESGWLGLILPSQRREFAVEQRLSPRPLKRLLKQVQDLSPGTLGLGLVYEEHEAVSALETL